jgi:leucyl/phenylalanyl-tRNA--protein transferase
MVRRAIQWLDGSRPPDPLKADRSGLVAIGGSLDPDFLLEAYRVGVFPWSSDPVINWWSPDPRMIFDLQTFVAHRSLRKRIRNSGWRFSLDEAFPEVINGCAEARENTWITPDFTMAYTALHERGHAHSVEVWDGSELVGGLYGVTIGGFFGGESMFHRRTDASKAAVAWLVEQLRSCGFLLLDAQAPNPHLERLGAIPIPRREYLQRLAIAVRQPCELR